MIQMQNDNPLGNIEILDNPLLAGQSRDLVISPGQELDQKIDMLNEIDSIATITKQQLSIRRQRVELEVENKKLDAGNSAMNAVGKLIDRVLEKSDSIKLESALDLKLYSESIERLANSVKMFMNSNVADEMGNKKRTKINFMFKSSGPVQGAISVDNSHDD
jgi:hypothetical protein